MPWPVTLHSVVATQQLQHSWSGKKEHKNLSMVGACIYMQQFVNVELDTLGKNKLQLLYMMWTTMGGGIVVCVGG